MQTLIATLALMAAAMLAMAVGVVFSGRRLKGSCGGVDRDCSCDAVSRAECRRTKAQAGS